MSENVSVIEEIILLEKIQEVKNHIDGLGVKETVIPENAISISSGEVITNQYEHTEYRQFGKGIVTKDSPENAWDNAIPILVSDIHAVADVPEEELSKTLVIVEIWDEAIQDWKLKASAYGQISIFGLHKNEQKCRVRCVHDKKSINMGIKIGS